MAGVADYPRRSKRGEPVWEVARLYPAQGSWSVDQYLQLETNQLVEFHDGELEFLPMPSILHQRIVRALLMLLDAWAKEHGGEVFVAPMPLMTTPKDYREPDLAYVRAAGGLQDEDRRLVAADVVMEVVSDGKENRERDYDKKRAEYAKAGIVEYWIVDPVEKRITVLALKRGKYIEHSMAGKGGTAESAQLKGFKVSADIFATK